MEHGENLLIQIWWNDLGWERPCKDTSLPVCNISKEGSCDHKHPSCSDSTIFSEYARYLKSYSDFKRVGIGKYVFFISRKINDDSFYLVGYFVVADKKKNFLNKTLTKISDEEWTFDFAVLGDRNLSKRLHSPIRFDRKLIEKLELPLKHPKDSRKGGIEFDRVDRNRRRLNELECIAQGTRHSRVLTDNDVGILLDAINKNRVSKSEEFLREHERKKNEEAKKYLRKKLRGLSRTKRLERINSLIEQRSRANAPGSKVTEGSSVQYERDYILADALKEKYENKCQICLSTFETKNNGYYSEVHHIMPLKEGGLDVDNNILILCPTCHRKLHHASQKIIEDMIKNAKKITDLQKRKLEKYHIS